MTRTVAITSLKTRPVFETLFIMEAGVLDAIAANMLKRGYDASKPIDLWKGVVVDGHTRRRAALAAGLPDVVVYDHDFADDAEALLYAINTQRIRRNLTPPELRRCVENYDRAVKKRRGRKTEKASGEAFSEKGKSALVTAAAIGTSRATVERLRAISADSEAKAALDAGASVNGAAKIAQANTKAKKEAATAFPSASVIRSTPVEDALRLAAIPGAFTVPEWLALDDATKVLLLTEAPILGGDNQFNRTNENVDWAHWTWNPVTGCLHDCPYCYARDAAHRFYPQKFVPTFIPARLHAPRHSSIPPAVATDYREANAFVCSMADLFGKWVPQEWIDAVFAEVLRAPDWRFLFLTKFPRKLSEQDWPANAWVGTSVDRQSRVEVAEKSFRDVRAGVKWLSCEPMLERLTFTNLSMFDWVVMGGESPNTNNRDGFDPPWEWIDHLYRQARDAGCRVYFKENLRNRPKELPAILGTDSR